MEELRCAVSLSSRALFFALLVAVYKGEWQFSAINIAIFYASFIISIFLYKRFFVNLVFSVLGSSVLRLATNWPH